MKFKATMGSAAQLSKLVLTLEKLADRCVVHLTPDIIQFGVAHVGKDSLHACADVNQRTLFLDYMVQSKAENNRVSFFVVIENLSRALKSCTGAQVQSTRLKLTKRKGAPTISFEILMLDSTQVLHDVPISVVSDPRETLMYTEPPVGSSPSTPPVAVVFPAASFRSLKNVVDRMRTVNEWVQLTTRIYSSERAASGEEGSAILELQASKRALVGIRTTYTHLGVTSSDSEDPSLGQLSAVADVEAKKLLRILSSLTGSDLKIQNAIVCVAPDSMVVLKIYLPDSENGSFLIFYLPVLVGDDINVGTERFPPGHTIGGMHTVHASMSA